MKKTTFLLFFLVVNFIKKQNEMKWKKGELICSSGVGVPLNLAVSNVLQ